jgi:hypothetical protein
MSAEDREREERLVQALRTELASVRAAAERLESASDVTAWGWRVDAVTSEALERAASFDRLAQATMDTEAP